MPRRTSLSCHLRRHSGGSIRLKSVCPEEAPASHSIRLCWRTKSGRFPSPDWAERSAILRTGRYGPRVREAIREHLELD